MNWMLKKIQENKLDFIKGVIGVLICLPLAKVMQILVSKLTLQDSSSIYIYVLLYVMLMCTYITLVFRKKLYEKAHIYVLVLVILSGSVQIIGTPPVVGISWDDEIHYIRSAYTSWGANGDIAPADLKLVEHYVEVIYERKEYSPEGREAWIEYIDQYNEDNAELVHNEFSFTKEYVAYIPSAIGLAIGRFLNMTFTQTFMFGKFVNLLCYAFITALAIKQLDRGKLLASVIVMFPTNIFMAASYSYDWWVTSLVLLGFSLFIGDVQKKRKISIKKMVLILSILIVAMLPKAVYCPLLLTLMLFKDDRYEDAKICRWLVIGAILLLLASFILPILIGGAGAGDTRGGADVNASEQIKFILKNPFAYVAVLMRFLMGYLSPDSSLEYATFYAYIGRGSFATIALPILASACIIDNNAELLEKKENIWVKVGTFVSVAGSILLVVTALYVSFTPVGHVTVAGCQPRYLLPLFFPGLFILTKMGIDVPRKIKENVFVISAFTLCFVYLYNLFELCIIRY